MPNKQIFEAYVNVFCLYSFCLELNFSSKVVLYILILSLLQSPVCSHFSFINEDIVNYLGNILINLYDALVLKEIAFD